jgi:hypothetical protein
MEEVAALDNYYMKQAEPLQGCLLALKSLILEVNKDITPIRKYRIPFFRYKSWNLAFLWIYKKKIMIGFVTDRRIHPPMPGTKRKDDVETMLIDPNKDIPLDLIATRLRYYIKLYDNSGY